MGTAGVPEFDCILSRGASSFPTRRVGIIIIYIPSDAEGMQSKAEICTQFEALGLMVDDTGVIRGRDDEVYGMLSNAGLVMGQPIGHREALIPYEHVSEIGRMDDGTLTVTTPKNGMLRFGANGRGARDVPPIDGSRRSMEDAFPLVFPDWSRMMRRDELADRDYVDLAMFGLPHEEVAVDDTVMALYRRELDKGLRRLTGARIKVSETVMDEAWTLAMAETSRNPFRDWMESQKWDGVPRLRSWFIDYLGVTAFPLTGEDERTYIESVTEAWFMGAVARQYGEVKHEVVPVLLGEQGIGKGSVLRFTAGDDRWYKDTAADVTDARRFLESITGAVVVELSEASQIRTKDAEALKAFISQSADMYRDPYGRKARAHRRRFVLIASTNLRTVFTDVTGNRRFYPLECHGERATKIHSTLRSPECQHEVEQLWAEALFLYREGRRHFLPPTVDLLAARVQEGASVENPAIEDINDLLDDSRNGFACVDAVASRTDIIELLQARKGYLLRDAQGAYRVWSQSRNGWERLEKPKRVGQRVKRGWVRVSTDCDRPAAVRAPSAEDGREDVASKFKRWRDDSGAVPFMPYPRDGSLFTDKELEELQYLGLVVLYDDGATWCIPMNVTGAPTGGQAPREGGA